MSRHNEALRSELEAQQRECMSREDTLGVIVRENQRLRRVLELCMEEFDNRYDGAPDAHYQWMGELMREIQNVLGGAQ